MGPRYNTVGSNTSSDNTLNAISCNVTITAGNNYMIIVGITAEHTNDASRIAPTSVTFNGVAMTMIDGVTQSGGAGSNLLRTELWVLHSQYSLAPGTYTATATFSNSNSARGIGCLVYTDVKQASPESTSTAGVNANAISASVTPLYNSALVVAVCGSENTGSYTADGGQTERYDATANTNSELTITGSEKIVTTPVSTTMGETHNNGGRQAMVVASFAYQPPGGGAFAVL